MYVFFLFCIARGIHINNKYFCCLDFTILEQKFEKNFDLLRHFQST